MVLAGKSVFFTGNAGTGKTFLLNQIISELRLKYGVHFADKVALAAPTGIAATHIQGAWQILVMSLHPLPHLSLPSLPSLCSHSPFDFLHLQVQL